MEEAGDPVAQALRKGQKKFGAAGQVVAVEQSAAAAVQAH